MESNWSYPFLPTSVAQGDVMHCEWSTIQYGVLVAYWLLEDVRFGGNAMQIFFKLFVISWYIYIYIVLVLVLLLLLLYTFTVYVYLDVAQHILNNWVPKWIGTLSKKQRWLEIYSLFGTLIWIHSCLLTCTPMMICWDGTGYTKPRCLDGSLGRPGVKRLLVLFEWFCKKYCSKSHHFISGYYEFKIKEVTKNHTTVFLVCLTVF